MGPLARLTRSIARRLPRFLARELLPDVHPFDLRYGTDTSGLLYPPDLPTGHPHDQSNEGYYATAPSMFRNLMARWTALLGPDDPPVQAFSFVDLGCGKGRVLLLASELPFRSITGIELHANLAAIAQANARLWAAHAPLPATIHVRVGDVLTTPLPDGPLVLFLFNSFGEPIVRSLRDRLTALAHTRLAPIFLLYMHPDQDHLLADSPHFHLLLAEDVPFSREDGEADAFHVDSDLCHIYRLDPSPAPL